MAALPDILVLDDDPERVRLFRAGLGHRVFHAPSASMAIRVLEGRQPGVARNLAAVFLDHDLYLSRIYYGRPAPGSGSDVVEHLWERPRVQRRAIYIVHSLNEQMGPLMAQALRDTGRTVNRRTFAWQDLADLRRLARTNVWPMAERTSVWI